MTVCLCALRGNLWSSQKDHICRFHKCILVVLDGGNERVDSVMCLCARFGAKLVRVESVVGLGVCRKSG